MVMGCRSTRFPGRFRILRRLVAADAGDLASLFSKTAADRGGVIPGLFVVKKCLFRSKTERLYCAWFVVWPKS